MKRLLLCFFVMFSAATYAEPNNCTVFDMMDDSQFNVLRESYEYGKPYNMGYTLAAQSWKESSAGKKLHRPDIRGGSFGIYQSLLDNVLWREYGMHYNATDPTEQAPDWLVAAVKERLKVDHAFAAKHAILELQFWKVRTKSWRAMLSAYNGGYSGPRFYKNGKPKNPQAQEYARRIARYVVLLRHCKDSPIYGH